jgi:hypothetical protein
VTIPPILCALFSLLLTGCRSSADRDVSYQHIAYERLGKHVEFVPNADSSFVLCLHHDDSPPPMTGIRFFVWDRHNGTMLLQDSLMQADVFWIDATHIRVVSSPEVSSGDDIPDRGYVFDVREGRKSPVKQ